MAERTNPLFDKTERVPIETAAPWATPAERTPQIVECVCGEFGSNRVVRVHADLSNRVVIPITESTARK